MGVALNPNARYTHTIATDLVLPVSYCGWVRVGADRNNFTTLCWLGDDTTVNHCVLLALNSDGVSPIVFDDNFDADVTAAALSVGTWYFVAVTAAAGAGNLRLYVVAEGGTLALTDSATYGGTFDAELIGIGGGRPDGEVAAVNADASFSCWRFWTAALSLAELQAEMASPTPVRTSGLWSAYRFADTATATADSSGNGRNLTATAGTGSFANTDDPFDADTVTGTIAATLPALAVAAAGDVRVDGTLAATLPALTTDLDGTSTVAGSLASTLPALTAGLSGAATVHGELTAALPALTVALDGSSAVDGVLAADLPALGVGLAGNVSADGTLTTTLPALEAALAGTADTGPGLMAVVLPALDAVAAGDVRVDGTLTAELPRLTVGLDGASSAEGVLAVSLPALVAAFTSAASQPVPSQGTYDTPTGTPTWASDGEHVYDATGTRIYDA